MRRCSTIPNVDAVIVAIADQFHVSAARQAVAAGKHVLVEKPMGVTVEECEELAQAVHEAGVVLQVGTQRRYDPNIAYAADFIRHEMGEVLAMRAWYCDSSYRYTVTDAIQPLPIISDARRPARGQPEGRLRALLPARPRQPPRRHRAVPVRADRRRARAAHREVRRLQLVHQRRLRRRQPRAPGPHAGGAHGLARGLPRLRRARLGRLEVDQPVVLPLSRRRVLLDQGRCLPPAAGRRQPVLPPPDRRAGRHGAHRRAAAGRRRRGRPVGDAGAGRDLALDRDRRDRPGGELRRA